MNRPPKKHFVSADRRQTACGVHHANPDFDLEALGTVDVDQVNCSRCLRVLDQAATAGRMVFGIPFRERCGDARG